METYAFFQIPESSNRLPALSVKKFDNVGEAKRHALSLLAKCNYTRVEIWDGRSAIRVNRESDDTC
jgi:hypothetical protein